MAQSKPEYEPVKEFKTIANKLVQKYPEVLDGVNPSLIACVAVTNKDPKEGKPMWELKSVPYPLRLDNPYDHYLVVNSKDWFALNEKHQALLVFDALCSIDREEPNKTVPFDLKDHAVVIRTIGPDYMDRDDIPDIINEDIKWKKEVK